MHVMLLSLFALLLSLSQIICSNIIQVPHPSKTRAFCLQFTACEARCESKTPKGPFAFTARVTAPEWRGYANLQPEKCTRTHMSCSDGVHCEASLDKADPNDQLWIMKMVLRHTTQWLVAPDPRVEELMKKCCDIRYLRTFDARLIARDPLTFSGETISAFCDWKEHLDHAAYCREHFHSFVMWPLECEVEVDTCRVIQGRLESNKKCQWRDKAEEMFLEHPDDCSEGWDSDSDTL